MATAHCTTPVTIRSRGGSGRTDAFIVESTNVIYNGSLVWRNKTTGRCTSIPMQPGGYTAAPNQSDTAVTTDLTTKKFEFLGIAVPSTNSVTGDVAGSVTCPVNTGGVILENLTVTGSTLVGDPVYAKWNDPVNAAALKDTVGTDTTRRSIGYVTAWTSATNCDVQLWDCTVPALFLDPALQTTGR